MVSAWGDEREVESMWVMGHVVSGGEVAVEACAGSVARVRRGAVVADERVVEPPVGPVGRRGCRIFVSRLCVQRVDGVALVDAG